MSVIKSNHGGLGGSGAPGGALGAFFDHTLDSSLRFDTDDSPKLFLDPTGSPTTGTKCTISLWFKRSSLGSSQALFTGEAGSVAYDILNIGSNDKIQLTMQNPSSYGLRTDAVFRDLNAWYHLVVECDTTVGTAADRFKMYVNGEQQTLSSVYGNYPQDHSWYWSRSGSSQNIGRSEYNTMQFNGLISEFYFIDGIAHNADTFGETKDGVWVPKDPGSLTFGNNGFYLPMSQTKDAGFSTHFPDDNSDYITHSDSTAYDIGSSDDFTIEFFFNTDDVGGSGTGGYGNFMGHYATSGPHFLIGYDFRSTTRLIYWYTGNGAAFQWDVSGDVTLVKNKWHHMVFQRDGTTLRAYIDGTRLTSISDSAGNTGYSVSSGKSTNFNKAYDLSQIQLADVTTVGGDGFDGFLSNVRFVIGNTVYADDDNNITVPTTTLTAITGTKLLTCHNATVGDDASSENNDGTVTGAAVASTVNPFGTFNFFQDASGNNNHFSISNLDDTDVGPDSPTNSFAYVNPLDVNTSSAWTPKNNNTKIQSSANNKQIRGNFLMQSGKWYWETRRHNANNSDGQLSDGVGISLASGYIENNPYQSAANYSYYSYNGNKVNNNSFASYGDSWNTAGDIVGVAFDADNGAIWFSKNGTWQNSATASEIAAGTTTNAAYTGLTDSEGYVCVWWRTGGTNAEEMDINFGTNPSFNQELTGSDIGTESGNGDALFKYAPPTGFKALVTSNMPDITIGPGQSKQADNFFETMLYTGNGAEQHIGAGGIQHPQDTINITNSLRFEAGSSAYLSRTQGSSPTNIGKWTVNFWLKRTNVLAATDDYDTVFGVDGPGNTAFTFLGGKIYLFVNYNTSGSQARLITNREFLNTATFYNFHVTFDRTASTASERLRLYVNGVEETSFSTDERSSIASDSSSGWNVGGLSAAINRRAGGQDSRYHNGYIAQFYNIDGAVVAPTEFAQVGSSGHWIPKTYTGSYGNNGWLLEFKQTGTGSGATNTVGADTSGNTNHWDSSGIAAEDVTIDSPTQNFSVMNPNRYSAIGSFSEGNLKVTTSTNNRGVYSTIAVPSSGKWYYEVRADDYVGGGGAYLGWGTDITLGDNEYTTSKGITFSTYNQQVLLDGSGQSGGYGSNGTDVTSDGDVYSVLLDVDNGLFYYAKNGTYFNSANPSNGTGGLDVSRIIAEANTEIRPVLSRGGSYNEQYLFNFGQDPSFNGGETAPGTNKTDANGVGKFLYDVPTGFLALMDDNIPQEGIESPDWVWIKARNNTTSHNVFDSVRGVGNALFPDGTGAESATTNRLLSFDGQGFTIGDDTNVNNSTTSYVAFAWKAGTSVSGTTSGSGTGKSYVGSVNTTSGFSIIAYSGNGTAGHTIPHHLGVAPKVVISKKRSSTGSWGTYHGGLTSASYYILLNDTAAEASNNVYFNGTAPTDSVVTRGSGADGNANDVTYVQYAFAEIEGYSKFGSYFGNGNSSGTYVYTGFRPAWVMVKCSSSSQGGNANWRIQDSKRLGYNPEGKELYADLTNTEASNAFDILSNGFKIRNTSSGYNSSGATYIYLAFAETPFKFANAR